MYISNKCFLQAGMTGKSDGKVPPKQQNWKSYILFLASSCVCVYAMCWRCRESCYTTYAEASFIFIHVCTGSLKPAILKDQGNCLVCRREPVPLDWPSLLLLPPLSELILILSSLVLSSTLPLFHPLPSPSSSFFFIISTPSFIFLLPPSLPLLMRSLSPPILHFSAVFPPPPSTHFSP